MVPKVATPAAGLEAELEGDAAQNQRRQHQDYRHVDCGHEGGEGHREGGEHAAAAKHQPGFVAVPHGGDGIHHDVAMCVGTGKGEQDPDAEIEAVKHYIHKDGDTQND